MSLKEMISLDGAWITLSVLWSLNGPLESVLMRQHSAPAYAKAKAIAVGATYLASPIALDETLAVVLHPLFAVLFIVSLVNTPMNAYIIKHGDPAVQLPLAQVISQLLRALWWSFLDKPLTTKQYVGIVFAALSCICLR